MWLTPEGIPYHPQKSAKIISLVPSLTELLIDCGLENQIVGRTKFCIHPKEIIQQIAKVGGTKKVNFESVRQQNPDILLANKEENTKEDIEQLSKYYPVYVSDIRTIQDLILFVEDLANYIPEMETSKILNNMKNLRNLRLFNKEKVAYLIWQNPFMTVGSDTFIHHILESSGFKNVFKNETRYPEITVTDIQNLKPEYIFLSSEPYPFKKSHLDHFRKLFPKSTPCLVDGEMFSWYGSRILKLPAYLENLKKTIHGLKKPVT